MRKFVPALLLAMGVTDVHDAPGGASGLVASGVIDPDVVILDWQVDGVNGPACMGRVRAVSSPTPMCRSSC
jgi:DNA-binding response OmpR family regulator